MSLRLDKDAAVALVREFLAVAGSSGHEAAMAAQLRATGAAAGIDPERWQDDRAHQRTDLAGDCGNQVLHLPASPGAGDRPHILLCAHLDTVPLAVGGCLQARGDRLQADGEHALGADDRAGCAAIVTALRELLGQGLPHGPLTLLFTVQEEVGLAGARHLDAACLGQPDFGINVDGGPPWQVCIGAVAGAFWQARLHGIAAHAGVHPQSGVSAATIFACALADLTEKGWHGKVQKSGGRGTANVGNLEGGQATNVVMERLIVSGECRSHSHAFLRRIAKAYEQAFDRAARSLANDAGDRGRSEFSWRLKYPAFRLRRDTPALRHYARALRRLDRAPEFIVTDGGLDANWLNHEHGVPTITIGAGGHHVHTVREYLDLSEYLEACRALLAAISG